MLPSRTSCMAVCTRTGFGEQRFVLKGYHLQDEAVVAAAGSDAAFLDSAEGGYHALVWGKLSKAHFAHAVRTQQLAATPGLLLQDPYPAAKCAEVLQHGLSAVCAGEIGFLCTRQLQNASRLDDLLGCGVLSEQLRQALTQQAARALCRLHRCGFVHGEATTDNFIHHSDGVALVDFKRAARACFPTRFGYDLSCLLSSLPADLWQVFLQEYFSQPLNETQQHLHSHYSGTLPLHSLFELYLCRNTNVSAVGALDSDSELQLERMCCIRQCLYDAAAPYPFPHSLGYKSFLEYSIAVLQLAEMQY